MRNFICGMFVVGAALLCNAGVTYSYVYNSDGDDTITITAVWCSGTIPDPLEIPGEYEGHVVTRLIDGVSSDMEDSDFTDVKNIVLPNTLLSIDGNPFVDCEDLETVEVRAGGRYKTRDNMLLSVDETELVSVYGKKSFSRTSLTIPETVERMGHLALFDSRKLKSVVIPKNVREIIGNPFVCCYSLESVTVDPENQWFKMVNDCLVTMDGKRLIALNGPNVKDGSSKNPRYIAVPDGVEEIGELSLTSDMVNIRKLWLPSSVTSLDEEFEWGTEDDIVFQCKDSFVRNGELFCNTDIKNVWFMGPPPTLGCNAYWGCGKVGTIHVLAEHYSAWQSFVAWAKQSADDDGSVGKLVVNAISEFPAAPGSVELDESYGPYTPGEKVSLSITGLAGYSAKGLPSGLKLNKKTGVISGAPKKPTGDEGVTVTFTKKGAETLTTKFIVGPVPTISVTLAGDTEKCKVRGAKAYLVGKKVSLSAKAPKGTAFTGWYKDGQPWPSEDEYLSSKIKYVMTAESLELTACFEKEKMTIDSSALESAQLKVGSPVAEGEITIPVSTQSGLKSVSAKGLPKGLKVKFNKTTGVCSLAGTPKKAGTFSVTIKATAKSGAVEIIAASVEVIAE